MDFVTLHLTFFTLFITFNMVSMKIIKVDSVNGNDTSLCLMGTISCKTLDYVFNNGSRNLNNTVLQLNTDSSLSTKNEFQLTVNFTLTSTDGAIINCTSNQSGMKFTFSSYISLVNIGMQHCGVLYPLPKSEENATENKNAYFAVFFSFCRSIRIQDSIFRTSSGIAIALYDVAEDIELLNTTFQENSGKDAVDVEVFSGGGVVIEFTYCGAFLNCSGRSYLPAYNHDTTVYIKNCLFKDNNKNPTAVNRLFETKGAGMLVHLRGTSKNNVINIEKTCFDGNEALWGGGLFVLFETESQNNTISVNNGKFKNNIAKFGGGGARVHSVYHLQDDGVNLPNKVTFFNTSFKNNSAIFGGGISVSKPTRLIYSKNVTYRDIYITKCTFVQNKATVGFALGLATHNLNHDVLGPGISYQVKIEDSKFIKNCMKPTEDGKVIGQGAVYSEEITLRLIGNNMFLQNDYTAIVLDSSSLSLSKESVSKFHSNTGLEGGSLALYGSSFILLEKDSFLRFENNSARRKGGAIYVKNRGPPRVGFKTTKLQTSRCFLRYENAKLEPEDWNVKIEFVNNSAPVAAGNSIYASTLQFCRQPDGKRIDPYALDWKVITYSSCNNESEVVTNAIDISINPSQWKKVKPNVPFTPDVVMRDEKNQSVYAALRIEILNKDVALDPPNNLFFIRDNISRLRLNGETNQPFPFRLVTTSGLMVDTEIVNGNLTDCPLGFELNKEKTKCVCMDNDDEVTGVIRCLENGTVYVLKGKWGFRSNSGKLNTVICPIHYCSCYKEQEGYLCELDITNQCAEGRTGDLCSRCKPGFSVQLGNEKCTKCKNTSLLLLIPLFIVLCLLVMLILYFNIDAFSGYLNAYLYSYQMVMLLIPENVQLDKFISFVIGITSVQGTGDSFGICLFNGMDNLQKLAINYVAPSSMIFFTFIMGLVIPQKLWQKIFYRRSSEAERDYRRNSFGRALSFVLVVCYSTFTGVTLKLLHWVNINDKLVLYEAAFVGYFEDEHVYYGILALIFLVFIVLAFPIVLLFTPFFTSRFAIIQRVEPILNALKNCFKEKILYRVFAAFYFVCRFILLLIAVFIQEEVTRLIVLSIACVIFQAVFSSVQPYRVWTNNFWDIVLLTNMCLISLLSLILSVPFTTSKTVRNTNIVFLKTLVYIPLITIVIRLVFYAYKRFQQVELDSPDGHVKQNWWSRFLARNSFRGRGKKAIPCPQRAMEQTNEVI